MNCRKGWDKCGHLTSNLLPQNLAKLERNVRR